jgi:hypothetical protein
MKLLMNRARVRALVAALLTPFALAGCDSLLDVENPQIVTSDDLNDADLVAALENGVRARFQRSFGDLALYTSFLSDELIDGHTYRPHRPWDLRQLDSGDLTPGRYDAAHSLRGVADTLATKIANLVENPGANLSMAWARAYAGYGFVFLGEYFCASPINASAPYTPDELLAMGIERFREAISIAEAAKSAGEDASEADEIINLARVGAARAALQKGDDAIAVEFAEQVPEDFVFWVHYSANGSETNDFYATTTTYNPETTGSRWAGIDPEFANLNDLRIVQTDEAMPVMDTRDFHAPYQPSSFSGWMPGEEVPFSKEMDIRVASKLEARYIVQEVQGPTLGFINERRAVGGQVPITDVEWAMMSPADQMSELRDQRRRDFFLDGHRLGDLRRYLERYDVNEFPSGGYPQFEEDYQYGSSTCIPISADELNSNPNL